MHNPSTPNQVTVFSPSNPDPCYGEGSLVSRLIVDMHLCDDSFCTITTSKDTGWPILLMWIPTASEAILDELTQRFPNVYNRYSADFRELRTVMSWETDAFTATIDTWEQANRLVVPGTGGFDVAFFNQTTGRLSSYRMDESEVLDFVNDIAMLESSSFVNYKAHRVWSDATLEEHSGREDVPYVNEVLLPYMTPQFPKQDDSD